MSNLDFEEWCPNCKMSTLHRHEHELVRGPGVFARLKRFCRECRAMTRVTEFK